MSEPLTWTETIAFAEKDENTRADAVLQTLRLDLDGS
jgi:hypothetical protein